MVIVFEYGRLGNQLFQYVGIKKTFAKHRIIMFGCDSLYSMFDGVEAMIIPRDKFRSPLLYKIHKKTIEVLAGLRLVSVCSETKSYGRYGIKKRAGIIVNCIKLSDCFFQHEDILSEIPKDLQIKSDMLEVASEYLNAWKLEESFTDKVFVHVRRGDYVTFPNREHPAVLNGKWYIDAMNEFRRNYVKPVFLIFTDDLPYATELFSEFPDVVISNFDMSIDFSIMSLCDHGILSASSFSWWAAYFARERALCEGKTPLFIAPKYWLGHNQGIWNPPGFKSKWLNYRTVGPHL